MKSLGILVNNTIQVTNNLAPLKLLEWKISLTNGSMVSLQNKYHKLFKKFKKSKLHIHELINKEAKNSTTSFFFCFQLLFGCPTTNFGPLSRGQPHHPNVNHCVLTILTQRSPGASEQGWVPNPGQAPSGVWIRNLPILTTTP